jgi:hypothetical protein
MIRRGSPQPLHGSKRSAHMCVIEATGVSDAPPVAELRVANLPVAVVNHRQVRAFAGATGRPAKTDRPDAQTLAHFGHAMHPTLRPLPDAAAQALAALARAAAPRRGHADRRSKLPGRRALRWCAPVSRHIWPVWSGGRRGGGECGTAPAVARQSALARAFLVSA